MCGILACLVPGFIVCLVSSGLRTRAGASRPLRALWARTCQYQLATRVDGKLLIDLELVYWPGIYFGIESTFTGWKVNTDIDWVDTHNWTQSDFKQNLKCCKFALKQNTLEQTIASRAVNKLYMNTSTI